MLGVAMWALCFTGAYLQAERRARGRDFIRALHAAHGTTAAVLLCAAGWAVMAINGYGGGGPPAAPLGVWAMAALFTVSTLAGLTWWIRTVGRITPEDAGKP